MIESQSKTHYIVASSTDANADDKSTRLLRGQSSENRKVYTENERAAAAKSARAYLVSKGPDEYRKYVKSKIEKEKKDKDNAPWDN